MRLHREERDYYVVEITATPPVAGTWQASFDNSATWVDGTLAGTEWSWLVAGPDFATDPDGMDPQLDTDATLSATTRPLLRVKDDPVLDVEAGPTITLWS